MDVPAHFWANPSGSALRNLFQVPLRLSAPRRGIVDFRLLKEVIDCVAALRSDLSAVAPPVGEKEVAGRRRNVFLGAVPAFLLESLMIGDISRRACITYPSPDC